LLSLAAFCAFFFFQAEDGIRDATVTGVQTCALPIFRDRLALIRDVGLTTGDTLAFSKAVRTHLDRFLLEDGISLNSQEKSALADIILRAAVGYGPLDSLLHDRSVSEIMVNGPDQVFIERRGVLTKADVRFEDE